MEQRRSAGEGFGKGHRVPLSFGETLRRMAAGDASLYLTTQVGGHKNLFAGVPCGVVACLSGSRGTVHGNVSPLLVQTMVSSGLLRLAAGCGHGR